jgi:hypothetical protein
MALAERPFSMSDSDDGSDARTDDESGDPADDAASGGRPCPICEEPMYSRHCKYVCPQHGVVYDCSDTFY